MYWKTKQSGWQNLQIYLSVNSKSQTQQIQPCKEVKKDYSEQKEHPVE